MNWILKHRPEDFRVNECLTLPVEGGAGKSRFSYLRLTKKGHTTFGAVEAVGAVLGVEPVKIGYAGLKDEDGITQQTLSVPGEVTAEALARFNAAHALGDEQFMSLELSGRGDRELRAGELQGNAFELVVRNMTEAEARLASEYARRPLLVVNYYDTQRFGVPGGPQSSHLIGRCLLEGRYEEAFELLKLSCTPEASKAQTFQGSAQEFFERLNPKVNAFYRSSAASHDWNAALARAVETLAGQRQTRAYARGALHVPLPTHPEVSLRVMGTSPELPYLRYEVREGSIISKSSSRTSVLQVVLRVADVARDEVHPGAWRASVNFLLPAGAYATMVVSNLFFQLQGQLEQHGWEAASR